jgi:Fe-S-cluster-containing dehydrogenase component/anaerobic selenocysteine-containing dehydrogenase
MNDNKLIRLSRRSFTQALGISGVVSLTGCERQEVQHALPLLELVEDSRPGEVVRYASTCLSCPAACGLLVSVRDGRPIKLEGLPSHPQSLGGLCALAQASTRGLFDAGRLRSPMIDGVDAGWSAVDARVREGLQQVAGKLAVLSPTLVSPTARKVIESFVAQFGGRLVEFDAGVSVGSAVLEAYRLLDGEALYPAADIGKANVLLTLGGDPFASGPEPVTLTRQYADRRRARTRDNDFRHIHFEGNLSLTGAGADVRLRATASERTLFAAHLLAHVATRASGEVAELAKRLTSSLPAVPAHERKIADLAAELMAQRGAALVLSASRQTTEQVAVALLNRLLAAEGATLRLDAANATQRGRDADLAKLIADVGNGTIQGVVIIELNPVEQLPNGEAFAAKLRELPLSVAVTSRRTATAAACKVVAASHHELERWGDAAPRRGTLTVAQPTMRPMFDTSDPLDAVLRWSGDEDGSYREHLKAQWSEAQWSETLSRGTAHVEEVPSVYSPGAGPSDDAALTKLFAALRPAGDGLEVELLEEVGLRDGRNSFNPWLRELPDPLTRTSWTATVRLAPSLAAARSISDGDIVTVDVGERSIEMQARILPGQHPRVLGVPVGYGVVDGDGGEPRRNGYRLARFGNDALQTAGLPATLQLKGAGPALPLIQWHSSTEGRPIVHQVSHDEEAVSEGHHPEGALWGDDRHYSPHWHMVIDLDSCNGCSACIVACQAENNLPVVGPQNITDHRDMYWLRMDRYFVGDDDDPEVLFEPMLCAQCDNAPCETVCPVAATVHSHDGLNMQVYNRCVGTRYCANNCPYKVRRFNWFDFTPSDPLERLALNPDVVVRERGTMEKCTFCVQRIQRARIEGSGAAAETACQQSCPARAITFGDRLTDPRIAEQQHLPRAFQVLADLGIRPSVTYLARVRRRDPAGGKGT